MSRGKYNFFYLSPIGLMGLAIPETSYCPFGGLLPQEHMNPATWENHRYRYTDCQSEKSLTSHPFPHYFLIK